MWHRDRLDEAQRRLRDIKGVTVLIYDQHCAADARRQRKRGTLPTRTTRVVINEAVCEGCGDCGVKSNCLSVQPVDTEFGRKTRIDQTSCNTDYSCLDGDCPSFVTVEVDPGKKRATPAAPAPPCRPTSTSAGTSTHNVFLAGIGGTGIVTVNQVLATAALRAGYKVAGLDQTGLSQKAGPVTSHLRIAAGTLKPSNRVTPGTADCFLAFDLLVAADTKNLGYGARHTSRSRRPARRPPATWCTTPRSATRTPPNCCTAWRVSRKSLLRRAGCRPDALRRHRRRQLPAGWCGPPAGALRCPRPSRRPSKNGVAVATNIAAFRWGRAAVAGPVRRRDDPPPRARPPPRSPFRPCLYSTISPPSGETRRRRRDPLGRGSWIGFQGVRTDPRLYVPRRCSRVWEAERAVTDRTDFSAEVAFGLYKFTAYKDEYEVARRLTDPGFPRRRSPTEQVPGRRAPHLPAALLAPLRAMGLRRKIGIGPRGHLTLRLLAKGKRLRGTAFDPFGRSHVRRVERGAARALHRDGRLAARRRSRRRRTTTARSKPPGWPISCGATRTSNWPASRPTTIG